MELKKITSSIKIIFLATIIAGGMNYLIAWTGPTATPPGNNVPAPLNVAYDNPQQAKLGGLQLNTGFPNADIVGLSVFGKSIFNGAVQITTGAGNNKVLTSDTTGNATWQNPPSSQSTTVTVTPYCTSNGCDYPTYNTTRDIGSHTYCALSGVKYGYGSSIGNADINVWQNNTHEWFVTQNGVTNNNGIHVTCLDVSPATQVFIRSY